MVTDGSQRLSTIKEDKSMNKLQENKNARLRSVQGIMEETNMRRSTVMQIATEAGAVVRFGTRGIRIDADLFYQHLRKKVD